MTGAAASSPAVRPALGINARNYGGGEGQKRGKDGAGRGGLYAMQSIVSRLMWRSGLPADLQERVCTCGQRRKAPTVTIRMDRERGRASYSGLETCRNLWLCPVCNAKISEGRREELQRAVNKHKANGGEVYLMTLTFPHQRRDVLSVMVDGLRLALKKFNQSKPYTRTKKTAGRIGSIRAIEVTWTAWHGWHPHVHVLILAAPGMLDQLRVLQGAWVDALLAAKLADRSQLNDMLRGAGGESPAFDVQNGDYAADYVAKFGREASFASRLLAGETWGAARELVKGARKLSGVTPFTLLAVIAGCVQVRGVEPGRAMRLFCEYAKVFKGQRQLFWSPGLARALQLGELFTDDELAELDDRKPVMVDLCEVSAPEWSLVCRYRRRDELLRAAEAGGEPAVRVLLAQLRALAPPDRAVDATEQAVPWYQRGFAVYETPDGVKRKFFG